MTRAAANTAVVLALVCAAPTMAFAWEHNIATWPADRMPLPIHVRPEPARHTDNATLAAIVEQALSEWSSVSCSSLRAEFAGVADLPIAVDGDQVLAWESDPEDWIYGEAAAGATIIDVLGPNGPRVDILFNDVTFDWVVGANTFLVEQPEWGVDPNVEVDPLSVVTHELGHLLGLAHPNPNVEGSQPDPLATMVFALLPNAQQGTLAGDDKLGLCEKYPVAGAHECDDDGDCGDDETCRLFVGDVVGEVRLCDEVRGTFGDLCGRDDYWCGGICLFTALDYSDGYCSSTCEVHDDCPEEWGCAVEMSAGTELHVCEPGVERGDDSDVGVTPVDTAITPVEPGPDTGGGDDDADTSDSADATADVDDTEAADGPDGASDSGPDDRSRGASRGSGCTQVGAPAPRLDWLIPLALVALARRRR